MRSKIIHIIYLFSLLVICFSPSNSQTKTFMECIKNVPVLHYPLQYGCGGHELMRFMSADSFWQKKYSLFNGNYHVGRLFPEKKYVTLLVQSLDLNSPPVIYTYKSNGRVIDSLVIASSCYEVPSGLFRSENTY